VEGECTAVNTEPSHSENFIELSKQIADLTVAHAELLKVLSARTSQSDGYHQNRRPRGATPVGRRVISRGISQPAAEVTQIQVVHQETG